jgi:hypothetical protein
LVDSGFGNTVFPPRFASIAKTATILTTRGMRNAPLIPKSHVRAGAYAAGAERGAMINPTTIDWSFL